MKFAYGHLPRSAGCRPAVLELWTESTNVDAGFYGVSRKPRFRVVAKTGSAVIPLPAGSHPPYRAHLIAFTLDLRRSREVRIAVQ